MRTGWDLAGPLLSGPLCAAGPWPFSLHARLCDLRPRFLVKSAVGPGHRAVSRNGRVLLCSDRPPAELIGRTARVRLQTWHRAVLPGDAPEPRGVLLCVRCLVGPANGPSFGTALVPAPEGELALDVGGGLVLAFCADASWA